jgi:hypothetical protein
MEHVYTVYLDICILIIRLQIHHDLYNDLHIKYLYACTLRTYRYKYMYITNIYFLYSTMFIPLYIPFKANNIISFYV